MPKAPKKLYNMPEKMPPGTILTDKQKNSFCIVKSIGIGGFGEVYSACRAGEKNDDYVIKCEPIENGPLFCEINFYMRCAKEADILNWKKQQGLKSFGMPNFIASGAVTLNGKNHRYLVMPKYGRNVEYYFLINGKRLPTGTVYRIAIQMLHVLEYVHHCGYVHADLKAQNMLLGINKNDSGQVYLVDFGLAAKYHTDKDFKPNPKKAHNGTMEFESRDSHQGVETMRSDLEILAYNLIHWLGAELPWVRDKLLNVPAKVHAAKIQFMNNIEAELKLLFTNNVPAPLIEYLNYVNKLKHNEKPDYKKCRKIFQDALKAMKIPDAGDLDLIIKKSPTVKTTKRAVKTKRALQDDENDMADRNASDDDDDDVIFEPKPKKNVPKKATLKTTKINNTSPATNKKQKTSPAKSTPSPVRPKRRSPRSANATNDATPSAAKKLKTTPPGPSRRLTPLTAKANINISPAISLTKKSSTPSLATGKGSTIINDNTTPNPRAGKTYEFNFELDVSMDANVVVNVKRKKKAAGGVSEKSYGLQGTPKSSSTLSNGHNVTPTKNVKVLKVNDDKDESGARLRTPIVKVSKKVKRDL